MQSKQSQIKLLIAKGDEHYAAAQDEKWGDYFVNAYATGFHGNDFIISGEKGQSQKNPQQYCHGR